MTLVPDILVNAAGRHRASLEWAEAVTDAVNDLPTNFASLVEPNVFVDEDDNTLFQTTEDGTQIWGADDGVVVDDGHQMTHHRAAAVITGTGVTDPRVYVNTALIVTGAQNPGNVIGRRYEGGNGPSGQNGTIRDKELAQTTLAVSVADIAAAAFVGGTGELTLTSLGTDNGIPSDNTWPSGGAAQPVLLRSGSQKAILTYTGVDFVTNKLTGVTLVRRTGSAAFASGVDVTRLSPTDATLALFYGQAFMGKDIGFQDRSVTFAIQTAEVHCDDFNNGFYSGSRLLTTVNTLGPSSYRYLSQSLEPTQQHSYIGSYHEDADTGVVGGGRRVIFAATGSLVDAQTVLPAAVIPIAHGAGFPASGTVLIEDSLGAVQTVAYTSISADSAGQWALRGCTGGTGTLLVNAAVRQPTTAIVTSNRGTGAFNDVGAGTTVFVGPVGPTLRGGILIGPGNDPTSDVSLYRAAARQWKTPNQLSIATGYNGSTFDIATDTDTEPRFSVERSGYIKFGAGAANPVDTAITRSGVAEVSIRNAADSAYGGFHALSLATHGKTGATATPITLAGGTASGAPSSGAHIKGEVVFDDTGRAWYCTVAGTPGTWVTVTSASNVYWMTFTASNMGVFTSSAADLVTGFVFGHAFEILAWDFTVHQVGAGAGAALTFNMEINSTDVGTSPSTLLVNLAGMATLGQRTAGGAVSGANTGSASDTFSIELAAGGTIFTSGRGEFHVKVRNLD